MKNKTIIIIIFGILLTTNLIFGFMAFKNNILYHEAIKQGAEGIVIAMELNAACQSLGNFTQEEIENEWIELFLKNRKEEVRE